ncbi:MULTISPECIES: membrane-bound PQQ-dependent dehydrogenase, glucose/quinate/shikimate family [Rhodopseudomonas]|uniref:Glucose dehydrogenase n=1 Tax=Rhodopseudomonas palustris TaxID=1076 RepID=A0A0D7EH34_RHOPL|nr:MULTISPECIES: membrane-bound PQQ-dependent dehydrogenase, glucose/quinate/shikimate family [Rhodopseudomonas]KIZ38827.1 glucose dehydrogenase [Rhodopseudomonas palustris]MDF3814184.1 membrane-bound PQQ-dependent dehydrogenase, glucose/quinate/shikimate family [Rhodopseudomonas sp. BAL398]WOK18650.1 membrane-bound PQQ-dependent dehydrogenase, glucose/quinate/shikimate family [Rhodopseudomonas sp. BAL398]
MDRARTATDWAAIALGVLMILIGVVLAVGGVWLLSLGGSFYYPVVGLGLIASGALIADRRAIGAWVYVAVFVFTLVWAWWEIGANGWAWVPRIVGPMLLLIAVLALAPRLASRSSGVTAAIAAAICLLVVAVGGFSMFGQSRTASAAVGLMPAPRQQMADPSPLKTGADWPAYGGSYSARRYSPLNQITADNVAQLTRVWIFHTGDLPDAKTKGTYGAETTPLKIGDSLYLCTPKNIMIALDASTGTQRWRYDPKVPDENIPYTAACRSVVYYATPNVDAAQACATRIIEGTLDARIIAVDAKTGEPCADFGEQGQVDTTIGIGEHDPGMFSITSPPTVVRGVIVVGHQVLDGQKLDAPSGVIQGYDAVTGALRWAWDMGKPDAPVPPPPGQTYTRGTPNMWTTASGDEQLGLVYLPLGAPAGDYWSSERSQREKEFATSLVAIDVTTGKPAWHFQTVHNDVWDYDLGSQATLVDYPTADGTVPALVLPSKRGDIFMLDRRTGKPLADVVERQVPPGGVEPAQRAKTQPFSTYHTLAKPALTERDMWGMSPIDQMICRIQFRKASYDGPFTPPTSARHSVEYPGYNGGSDWGGVAVDPKRGVIIANYNDMPNYNRLVPRDEADRLGWAPRNQARGKIGGAEGAGDPQVGAPYAINVNAGWRLPVTGLLCKQPPYGGIRAIDLKTGKTLWDRPLGQARTNGPFGIPSMLPITIGTPNNGGAVVTGGGLIFIAATTDNLIRAIDIETGKTVWQDVLPAGGQATPMTYEANGRQYVVIMAGGHHFMETPVGDSLVAYALPQK